MTRDQRVLAGIPMLIFRVQGLGSVTWNRLCKRRSSSSSSSRTSRAASSRSFSSSRRSPKTIIPTPSSSRPTPYATLHVTRSVGTRRDPADPLF